MKKFMKLALLMLMALVVLISAASVKAATEENPGTSTEESGDEEKDPSTEDEDNDGELEEGEKPEELIWTDKSKVKFTVDSKESGYNLKITGLKENGRYYVYISNTTKPVVKKDTTGKPTEATYSDINTKDNRLSISKFFALNGNVYFTLVETQYDVSNNIWKTEEIISGETVKRPDYAKIGTRMQCFFLNDYTSTFVKDPMFSSTSEGKNIKIKIGTVEDKEILKAIKNKESDSLSKLLAYAKDSKSIYTGKITVGESKALAPSLGLKDRAYYYVYMELDNEDGTYYSLEDVSLYQAIVGPKVGSYLCDYLNDNFKWNIDSEEQKPGDKVEDPKKDDTVIPDKKLPQTGVNLIGLGIGSIVLVIGIVFAVKSKKYSI